MFHYFCDLNHTLKNIITQKKSFAPKKKADVIDSEIMCVISLLVLIVLLDLMGDLLPV